MRKDLAKGIASSSVVCDVNSRWSFRRQFRQRFLSDKTEVNEKINLNKIYTKRKRERQTDKKKEKNKGAMPPYRSALSGLAIGCVPRVLIEAVETLRLPS
jgi:hypothetical protein